MVSADNELNQDDEQRLLAIGSCVGLAVFVAATVVETLADPYLSPLRNQISEYANDPSNGWVMTVAFYSWAASLLQTASLIWLRRPSTPLAAVAAGSIAIAGAAMIMTALFHTQTVAGLLPPGERLGTPGVLHDVGSGVATLGILGSAIAIACDADNTTRLRQISGSVVLTSVVADIALLALGRPVGGVRERLLVGLAVMWQATVVAAIGGLRQTTRPGSRS